MTAAIVLALLALNTPSNPPIPGQAPTPPIVVDFSFGPNAKIVFDGDSVTAGGAPGTGPWCDPMKVTITAAFNGAGATPPTYANVAVSGRSSTATAANVATPAAQHPTNLFLLSSLNDQFFGIPPSTTAANYVTYLAGIQSVMPGARIYVVSNLWGATEHWPEGTNAEDAAIEATNVAAKGICATNVFCKYIDIRSAIFAIDEPANNPTNLATGVLIQPTVGDHPTNPLGQTVVSNRVYPFLTLVFH